jgi:DedD protein
MHMKKRLTGALIIVALLVVLVPEILPDPAARLVGEGAAPAAEGPPLRTYLMDLGGAGRAESDQSALAPQAGPPPPLTIAPVIVMEPTSVPPSPASERPAVPAVSVQSAPNRPVAANAAKSDQPSRESSPRPSAAQSQAERSSAAPASPATPRAESIAPSGGWWVQMGSFSQSANAQQLAQTLSKSGFPTQVSPMRSNGKDLYRVRAGPVVDRAAAEALRTRLAEAGHKGTLVAP